MPGSTDLYFTPEDSQLEVQHPSGRRLPSRPLDLGHQAGRGPAAQDAAFVDGRLRELLGS